MTKFLKGNYTLDVTIDETGDGEAMQTVEEFERKALSRLGGSICFVSKKGFLWKGEDGARTSDRQPS
ncbi:MAG: hypothetical protein DMF83_20800 [Acidobacteria bacterium]|nr:MAG: hypothetical protein DMF83_20800 [Acidobacteriota bacterium]